MLENFIWGLAVLLAIGLVFSESRYKLEKQRAERLLDELEMLKNKKSKLDYFECLLDNPKTANELRQNSSKLIYLLVNFKQIQPKLDLVVRQALSDKISGNTAKIKEIFNGENIA